MSETTTIKVSIRLRNRLAARAKARHISQSEVLVEALEALDQRDFWSSVSRGYQRLQSDPQEWHDYVAERDGWINASMAGDSQ